jgi:hypothetical protein
MKLVVACWLSLSVSVSPRLDVKLVVVSPRLDVKLVVGRAWALSDSRFWRPLQKGLWRSFLKEGISTFWQISGKVTSETILAQFLDFWLAIVMKLVVERWLSS